MADTDRMFAPLLYGRRGGRPQRRGLVFLVAVLSVWACAAPADPAAGIQAEAAVPFTFQKVVEKAKQLAQQPFEKREGQIPKFLQEIGYDQWRGVRFRPEQSLWRSDNLNFEVQFFHPGFLYNTPVAINVVNSAGSHPIAFSPDLFDYGLNDFKDRVPKDLGFAGFRVHYPINTPDYRDEVAVFLGASYFRAVGQSQGYGLSMRGLAIDTASESGEQFPYFREFWLVKPGPSDTRMIVYALLDSPSMTGAYSYAIEPGTETLMDVHSVLFQRGNVRKLGIAPAASMFYYGENINLRPADDFRPEVHDSDGLFIAFRSGEWLWRPLANPQQLSISVFETANPVGFGLLQRDINFDHYQDLEARYERRPSVWITPTGDWGKGHIELIEIPTKNEYNDNAVAFWVPERLPERGQPIELAYRLTWFQPQSGPHGGGRVVATRVAAGKGERVRLLLIDFAGGKLKSLPKEAHPEAVVMVGEGAQLVEQRVEAGATSGTWRLVVQIRLDKPGALEQVLPDRRPPIELRAFLREGQDVLTETWSYAVER